MNEEQSSEPYHGYCTNDLSTCLLSAIHVFATDTVCGKNDNIVALVRCCCFFSLLLCTLCAVFASSHDCFQPCTCVPPDQHPEKREMINQKIYTCVCLRQVHEHLTLSTKQYSRLSSRENVCYYSNIYKFHRMLTAHHVFVLINFGELCSQKIANTI